MNGRSALNNQDLTELNKIILDACRAIMEIYETEFSVELKEDESPLTKADLASHEIIVEGLKRLFPDIPVLSEESTVPEYDERRAWSEYWLVDPLDGTKEFVNRNGEFTVNIALIRQNEAVFGIVGVPVADEIYIGDLDEGLAILQVGDSTEELLGRTMAGRPELTVVASRNHGGQKLEDFLDKLKDHFQRVEKKSVGSSLKLCILASGRADFYPRIGPTNEWDIAAAHAILRAAGGEVFEMSGLPKKYNTKESLLNDDFFAVADRSYQWGVLVKEIS